MTHPQILWVNGLNYPNIPSYLPPPEREALKNSLVGAILEGILNESASYEYRLIPLYKKDDEEDWNILLTRGERTIFIICSGNYTPSQLYFDLEHLNPSLVIFINHPGGINPKKIEEMLHFTEGSLMEIHVPRILFPRPSVEEYPISLRSSEFIFRGGGKYQELIKIDDNLTPKRREKILNTIINWGPTLYEIVKFLNKLMDAYMLGCKLLTGF